MPRHSGTNNALYADGHVKTSKPLVEWSVSPTKAAASMQAAFPFPTAMYPTGTGGDTWSTSY